MKKYIVIFFFIFIDTAVFAQGIKSRLSSAIEQLTADIQFKHAAISMYVIDSKTGTVIYDKNSELGMAPASCQKVITSASAFELLGKDFRYNTYIAKDPSGLKNATAEDAGCLFIIGDGDPTLGSWRWKGTTDSAIFLKVLTALQKKGIRKFDKDLIIEDYIYGATPLPEGWVWQDIGNYYGAACFGFNWHENQFEMTLQPAETKGGYAEIITTKPVMAGITFNNKITTAEPGSGDNGYIYSAPYSDIIFSKGTIPLQKNSFTISGSMPDPSAVFKDQLAAYLFKNGIPVKGNTYSGIMASITHTPIHRATYILDSIMSPPLDSMNYWFLKKSINLYGEAFLKSLVKNKRGFAIGNDVYKEAIRIVQDLWKDKGIDPAEINIIDGSGLSPANRVTTNALVTVMQYAKQQPWFPSFYYDLPEANGIKMKDGYITGVRSYTGYIKSNEGKEYTFSFIINNFDGSAGTVREKMWKVLDIMK